MFEIRALTTLRFFAALAIVFSHVATVTGVPFAWMSGVVLSQGVSFFFVLSGFILSLTYDKADLVRRRGSFYWARFARVYPLYVTSLLLAVSIRLWVLPHQGVTPWILCENFLAEGLAIQSWFPRGLWPLNGVDWSISAEAFFYAIFPFVKRSRIAFVAVGLAATAFVTLLFAFGTTFGLRPGTDVGSFYRILAVNPLIRSLEFLLGVWLGTSFARRATTIDLTVLARVGWSAVEAAAIAACYGLSAYDFRVWVTPSTDAIFGGAWKTLLLASGATPAFAALIWVFALERGIVSRCLRWRPLVFLGAASYALYLLHELTYEVLMHLGALPRYGSVPAAETGLVAVGLLATMLALASAGHLLIERPIRIWLRTRIVRKAAPALARQLAGHAR